MDLRLIEATNRDLRREVAEGRFRDDLFYRLNVFPIELPPLRERTEDLPLLVEFFLDKHAARLGFERPGVTPDALAALAAREWPGNVRELENALHRAVILTKDGVIRPGDLPSVVASAAPVSPPGRHGATSLKAALAQTEREVISAALQANGYNRQATAEALQIERTTLYKKIKRFGLDPNPPAGSTRLKEQK